MTSRSRAKDPAKLQLVAELYYERGLSLQQIADLTGTSVPTVSRLRAEALKSGVVEIRVVRDDSALSTLQERLSADLGVRCHVTPGQHNDPRAEARLAGAAAAPIAATLMPTGGLVGWAGGLTVESMVQSLGSLFVPSFDSIALVGGWDASQAHLNANALVAFMSEHNGGRAHILNSPAWLPSREARDSMMSHPVIRETVELWDRVSVTFMGCGMPADEESNYFTIADRWSPHLRSEMVRAGVVGDVLGTFFNFTGELMSTVVDDHLIRPSIEQVRRMPRVVALLGGHTKARSLVGLARTGLVHDIITDRHCAEIALELLEQ